MKIFLLGVAATFMLSFGIAGIGVAQAYSTSGTTQTSAPTDLSGVNTLLSPFENFIQSLKWPTTGPLVNIGTGSPTTQPYQFGVNVDGVNINNNNLQSTWQNIVNDPLTAIPTLFLNVIGWVLGVALQIVNWLKGLVH